MNLSHADLILIIKGLRALENHIESPHANKTSDDYNIPRDISHLKKRIQEYVEKN